MNKIDKSFFTSAIICVVMFFFGIGSMIYMRQISSFTVFPLIAAAFFGYLTYDKWKESKTKVPVEIIARLLSKDKGDGLFTGETYHFLSQDENETEIFITSRQPLLDGRGDKLRQDYTYELIYLTDDGAVNNYNDPFCINRVQATTHSHNLQNSIFNH